MAADVVRLVLLSAPRRPTVTKHAHRTFGVPLPVNCSCATRKQLRGPLLSVKNASPCADLELATHVLRPSYARVHPDLHVSAGGGRGAWRVPPAALISFT